MARYKWTYWVVTFAILLPTLGGTIAVAGPSGLVDDFSGDLSAYTITRILDANGGGSNTFAWQITGGSIEISTTAFDGIEQYAVTRTDFTLDVGETLRADYLNDNLDSQDIGLYVGSGTPTMDVRADYVSVYVRNDGAVYSRGFNGTTEFALSGGGIPATVDGLFVTRSATDEYQLGWYEDGIRNVLVTRSGVPTITGGAIGMYADVRATGIRGSLDNLRIQPALVPGDVTGEGEVNMADFDIIKMNFYNTGQTREQGDLTDDGIVEFADFRQWKANVPPEMAAAALLFGPNVPEPSTAVLTLIVGLSMLAGQRCRSAKLD